MHGIIDINATTARAASEYPTLARLFGGYFHQDWHEEYPTSSAALSAFLHEAPPRTATAAASEIARLLEQPLDDESLGRVLHDGLDCNYVPPLDELTNADWLRQLRQQLAPSRSD